MIYKNKIKRIFYWLAVVSWMALIFYLSHQSVTESSELSTSILDPIVSLIGRIAPFMELDLQVIHVLIRKSAHFFAYFILGLLVIQALKGNRNRLLIGLAICVLYAISDEVHQLYIPGRSGEIGDVVIDSIGSFVGMSIYLLVVGKIDKNT